MPVGLRPHAKRTMAARIRKQRAVYAARLAKLLREFFRAQSRRVLSRLYDAHLQPSKAIAAPADQLLPPDEDRALSLTVQPFLSQSMGDAAQLASVIAQGGQTPETSFNAGMQNALNDAGQRIVGINDATRNAVQDALQQANAAGYSLGQIANGVPEDGYRGISSIVENLYANRAEAIARTEMGNAAQEATRAQWEELGVGFQEIIDGEDFDDDCAARNGDVVSIDESVELLHPNCTVVCLPVVGEHSALVLGEAPVGGSGEGELPTGQEAYGDAGSSSEIPSYEEVETSALASGLDSNEANFVADHVYDNLDTANAISNEIDSFVQGGLDYGKLDIDRELIAQTMAVHPDEAAEMLNWSESLLRANATIRTDEAGNELVTLYRITAEAGDYRYADISDGWRSFTSFTYDRDSIPNVMNVFGMDSGELHTVEVPINDLLAVNYRQLSTEARIYADQKEVLPLTRTFAQTTEKVTLDIENDRLVVEAAPAAAPDVSLDLLEQWTSTGALQDKNDYEVFKAAERRIDVPLYRGMSLTDTGQFQVGSTVEINNLVAPYASFSKDSDLAGGFAAWSRDVIGGGDQLFMFEVSDAIGVDLSAMPAYSELEVAEAEVLVRGNYVVTGVRTEMRDITTIGGQGRTRQEMVTIVRLARA